MNATPITESKSSLIWRTLRWVALVLFAIGLVRTAWVSEDSYITFRTIDNFFHGYGLRWNVAERVQTYSHPLWMMLMSVGHFLSGEFYFTALVLGGLCTAGALWLLGFRVATSVMGATCALFVLAFSKVFVEYSTSGLEAPLSHLLLAVFAGLYYCDWTPKKRLFLMALVSALAAVNRIDTLLLFGPALVVAMRGIPISSAIKIGLAGFLPLILWGCFATFYYGSPIPVTGYAKAMTGLPQLSLLAQGGRYFSNIATQDPVLLPALIAGLLVAFGWKALGSRALALGAALYCFYLLKIGGGYMAGRFLTLPLFVAVIILSRIEFRSWKPWLAPAFLVGTVAAGLSCKTAPLLSTKDSGSRTAVITEEDGIVDERIWWYARVGLLSESRDIPVADSFSERLGLDLKPDSPRIFVDGIVGLDGFMSGPGMHTVDPFLCDPLLMRLPVWDRENWRVGHFLRRMPDGYLESLAFDSNLIQHAGLARAYDDLRLITRGRLLDPKRLSAIVSLAFGAGKSGLDDYVQNAYRDPKVRSIPAAELPAPCVDGQSIWDPKFRLVGKGGVLVELTEPIKKPSITLGLGGKAEYRITFLLGERKLGSLPFPVGQRGKLFPGILAAPIEVPAQAVKAGYDRILIEGVRYMRTGVFCLAYLDVSQQGPTD